MEFTVRMTRELPQDWSPDRIAEWCRKIRRMTCTHKRLQEIACNRGLTEREDKQDDRIEQRIRDHCEPVNIVPILQGDPRGATVKLQVPSGKTDDWGQEGICVPAGNSVSA